MRVQLVVSAELLNHHAAPLVTIAVHRGMLHSPNEVWTKSQIARKVDNLKTSKN